MSKTCILVEYYLEEVGKFKQFVNFELFDNIKKAFDFARNVNVRSIDLVKANNTYHEEDGLLNYEDQYDTIREGIFSNIY